MAKKGKNHKKYSAEFKEAVIPDMREHHLGYRETVRKYWLDSKGREANYINRVIQWERIYLEEGVEGLMKERRGRVRAVDKPQNSFEVDEGTWNSWETAQE